MIFLLILAALGLAMYLFLQQAQFGALPSGQLQERINQSPNFREGRFQNLSPTPDITGGAGYFTVLKEFFFNKSKRSDPSTALPSQKTDLLRIEPTEDVLVWFGHSSYFLQIDGKKILVDPVLSGNASPLSFTTKSYPGTDIYHADDFPEIDYLFISHDHWDHLDYKTLIALKPKIKMVITGLGVGAHFERWGFDMTKVREMDWNECLSPDSGFMVHATPARHFSGRGFTRNKSLWSSFVFQTPSMKLFLGGDSGYDTHFAEIGMSHGPFDLAILECGQYHPYWQYIHMMPEEVVTATKDLRANCLMPVHWSKFSLALHAWDEPIKRVKAESIKQNLPIVHPMIGEKLDLRKLKSGELWWEQTE